MTKSDVKFLVAGRNPVLKVGCATTLFLCAEDTDRGYKLHALDRMLSVNYHAVISRSLGMKESHLWTAVNCLR